MVAFMDVGLVACSLRHGAPMDEQSDSDDVFIGVTITETLNTVFSHDRLDELYPPGITT